MGKELTLPKNIRQIGDIQGKEKIFLEDYVMTYIKKKEKQEKEGYLGIFLGERQEKEDTVYVFVRGILEVPAEMGNLQEAAENHGKNEGASAGSGKAKSWKEKLSQSSRGEGTQDACIKNSDTENKEDSRLQKNTENEGEAKDSSKNKKAKAENWMEKMERDYQEYFPDWSLQGCCVIGLYPTERMRLLSDALPEAGGLIYHLQEQEETIYRVENGRYRQIKGYFVFYEQNRNMQEYMASVFSHDSVEKEGAQDSAIRSFRKKVKEKGLQKNTSFLKLASSFFVVTVLVIGAIVVNRMDEIRDVRNAAGLGDTTVENEVMYVEDTVEGNGSSGASAAVGITGESVTGNVVSSSGAEAIGFPTSAAGDGAGAGGHVSTDAGNIQAGLDISVSSSQVSEEANDVQLGVDAGSSQIDLDASVSQADDLAGSDAFWSDVSLEDGSTAMDSLLSAQVQSNTDMADTQADESAIGAADQSVQTEEVQEVAAIRQTQAAYVIREGDTLADICNRYYGSLDHLTEICEANAITDANMIMPGQKIVLP